MRQIKSLRWRHWIEDLLYLIWNWRMERKECRLFLKVSWEVCCYYISFLDFRALQAQDINLDQCISTWVPKTQCIRDIVCKIKFPHGLHNTVEELVAATNFPTRAEDWPTFIGQAPAKEEMEQSRALFEREGYPNMYRWIERRGNYNVIFRYLCGIYVKKDVVGGLLALLYFRDELLRLTGLGISND